MSYRFRGPSQPAAGARLRLWAWVPLLAWGAVATAAEPDLTFERLGRDDGLASAITTDVMQDRDGFIWVGSDAGAHRYDGYGFKRYGTEQGLAVLDVRTIHEDRAGRLWTGSRYGHIHRLDRDRDAFVEVAHVGDWVNDIADAPDGSLWVATEARGIYRLSDTGEVRDRFGADRGGLGSNGVSALTVAADGTLWAGTSAGVARLAPGAARFRRWLPAAEREHGLKGGRVWDVALDPKGRLWVAGAEGGVQRYDPALDGFHHYPTPIGPTAQPDAGALGFYRGDVWVGTYSQGVLRLDPESGAYTQYRHRPERSDSLSDDIVKALYVGREGLLWVTTQDGVNKARLRPTGFAHYRRRANDPHSLSENGIWAFTEDAQGRVWIATDGGGLNAWRPGSERFRDYRADPDDPHSLPDGRVFDVEPRSLGGLWVVTEANTIMRLDPDTGRIRRAEYDPRTPAEPLLTGNDLLEDPQGRVWLATDGQGLHTWDPTTGKGRAYRHDAADPDSLATDSLLCLFRSRDGTLWIGTDNRGLDRLDSDSGTFRHYRHDPDDPTTLGGDTIMGIRQGPDGAIWVASYSGALDRLDPATGRVRRFGDAPGLGNARFFGLLIDDAGSPWVSTDSGLARLRPDSGRFDRFLAHHGVQAGSFNSGAYLRLSDGRMLFGGVDGFNLFDPSAVELAGTAPPVAFTELRVLNRPIAPQPDSATATLRRAIERAREIVLRHDQSVFSIGFSALSFVSPSHNRYAYRLRGFDQDWIDADAANRRATYTNLDPGGYTFEVRAADANGVWNERGASLAVTVLPPWWLTWWAYVAYAGIATAGGGVAVRAEHRRRQRERELERARQERQWAESLREHAHAMAGCLAPRAILALMLEAMSAIVGYRYARALLLDHGEPGLMLSRGDGSDTEAPSIDTMMAQLERAEASGGVARTDGPGHSLVLALSKHGQRGGVVLLETDAACGFSDRDLAAAGLLGEHASTALDNARLFAEVERLADDAQQASRAKSSFLAQMSHELRTPLNGVLGMSELLLDSDLDTTQRSYTQGVRDSGALLLNMINDILDMSKIEAGKLTLDEVDFDIGELLADVIGLFASRASSAGLALGYAIATDAPRWARGDSLRLKQVLINLLSNAFKFTEYGEVRVSASAVTAGRGRVGLRLEVVDSGIGIAEDAQARLFQPFQQADDGVARRYGGTGLGLAICRELVERMDGRIGVVSSPGEGSRFWLEVALAPAVQRQSLPMPLSGQRVAIRDGDPWRAQAIADFLTTAGAAAEIVALSADGDAVRPKQYAHDAWVIEGGLIGEDVVAARVAEGEAPIVVVGDGGNGRVEARVSLPVLEAGLVETVAQALGIGQPRSLPASDDSASAEVPRCWLLYVGAQRTEQTLVQDMLEHHGHTVDAVDSAGHARELVTAGAYDLLLVDCADPTLNGFQLLATLSEQDADAGIDPPPRIAVLATDTPDLRERATRAGADDCLVKPLTRSALLSLLERWSA